MSTKLLLGIALAVVVVAALLALAWSAQRTLERGLPPRDDTSRSQAAALVAANSWAITNNGGMVSAVLGTGSMAPYIPAGDPPSQIVAYAVTHGGATFYDVTPGALCLYRYGTGNIVAIHGAAKLSGAGWVMSGLHNANSDITMTRDNFIGIVARVFIWK